MSNDQRSPGALGPGTLKPLWGFPAVPAAADRSRAGSKKLSVAVYTVMKNEVANIGAYMQCCREADAVFIVDTGSTDGGQDLARREGATVHQATVEPWRFDVARNVSLSLVPNDFHICIKLDLDERLSQGWKEDLVACWTPDTTRASYQYVWDWTADGYPDVVYRANWIHSRSNYVWRYPFHEALYCFGGVEKIVALERLRISQLPRTGKTRSDQGGHELKLLRVAVQENPQDSRCAYLLGRELLAHGILDEAIHQLRAYLLMPTSNFPPERSRVMLHLSNCYRDLGSLDTALDWAYRAAGEYPYQRENWIEVAALCSRSQDWGRAYAALKFVFSITQPSQVSENRSYAWRSHPWELLGRVARELGLEEEAVLAEAQASSLTSGGPILQL